MWTGENDLKSVTFGRGSYGNRENIYAVLHSLEYVWTRPKTVSSCGRLLLDSIYSTVRLCCTNDEFTWDITSNSFNDGLAGAWAKTITSMNCTFNS